MSDRIASADPNDDLTSDEIIQQKNEKQIIKKGLKTSKID